jgi:Voltage gated calcium channel IQ domain
MISFLVDEMDQADEELRQTLKKLWPIHAKKNIIDLAVPPNSGEFESHLFQYFCIFIFCFLRDTFF